MKSLLSLVSGFALSIASCGFVGGGHLQMETLKSNASIILENHREWLKERPRKLAIQHLEEKDLPKELRKLGYNGAAAEEGLVILFSSDRDASEIQAVAVIMDDKDRAAVWDQYGWIDSKDPRIKYLKEAKMLSSTTAQSPAR